MIFIRADKTHFHRSGAGTREVYSVNGCATREKRIPAEIVLYAAHPSVPSRYMQSVNYIYVCLLPEYRGSHHSASDARSVDARKSRDVSAVHPVCVITTAASRTLQTRRRRHARRVCVYWWCVQHKWDSFGYVELFLFAWIVHNICIRIICILYI